MGVSPVTFNYAQWVLTFPELAYVQEPAAQGYFTMATLYVRNDGKGPINDPTMQTYLLNLTTAHIAKLFSQQTNGVPTTGGVSPPNGTVGRVDSATQGSVTASFDFPDQAPNAAWWNQTAYGAAAWAAMKPYRTFRYLGSAKNRTYNPPARYWGWGI